MDRDLNKLLDEAEIVYEALLSAPQLKWDDEKNKLILGVGFANPKKLAEYLAISYNYLVVHPEDKTGIKRLTGILLWARVLFNVDKLTLQEVKYIRERLTHGFVSLSGNKTLKKLPIPSKS